MMETKLKAQRSNDSSSRNSDSSAHSHMESPHSPLRFLSPFRFDAGDLPETPPYASPDKIIKFSPLPPPFAAAATRKSPDFAGVHGDRLKEEFPQCVSKVGPAVGGGGRSPEQTAPPPSSRRLTKAGLGFRVCEVAVCLVSFSVMAADKTRGWTGDSFDRYNEYRQHMPRHHFRYYFDFFMDQVFAYLLISSSSSAATRVDDWQSNWGKDEFTQMASASVSMSFLAFVAFAVSSLISGHNLCTCDPG